MNIFNILEAKTIYQTDIVKKCVQESANYSETNKDVPVPDTVFEAMKINASNPANLKIVALRGEQPALYIEAFEFFTFCEATNKPFDEAANSILNEYLMSNPELENAEFHVVFPSDCVSKNILGGENLGVEVKSDWAMKLIRGCRRYGLKVNIGKTSDYPEAEGKDESNNKEEIESTNESNTIEKISDNLENMVNKAVNRVNEEYAERKAVIDKVEEAKRAIEKYNNKNKKKKQEKYSEIKDSKKD